MIHGCLRMLSTFSITMYPTPFRQNVFDVSRTGRFTPPDSSSLFRGGKDRLCPTEQHGKIRGGCPCVQPGGSPGLPTGEGCFTVSKSTGTGWWQLKYFLFSTLPGEMIQFDNHIFQMGWNHQVGKVVAFQHVERNSGDVKMVDSKRALFPETVSVC